MTVSNPAGQDWDMITKWFANTQKSLLVNDELNVRQLETQEGEFEPSRGRLSITSIFFTVIKAARASVPMKSSV